MSQPFPYRIIHQFSPEQIVQLHTLYQGEWWSAGRTLEDVQAMVEHTDLIFGVVTPESPDLLGFARIITDRVYKAFLFDVIIQPEQRGGGIGTFLVEQILAHPIIARVRHVELYCMPERMPFYERHGFTAMPAELRFMRRTLA